MSDEHRDRPLPWGSEYLKVPAPEGGDKSPSAGAQSGEDSQERSGDEQPSAEQQPAATDAEGQEHDERDETPAGAPAAAGPGIYDNDLAAQAAALFAAVSAPPAPVDAVVVPEPVAPSAVPESAVPAEPSDDEPKTLEAILARRPDPRDRPPDPAGTQPKFDPASLLPKRPDDIALVGYATEIRDGEEESADDLLPARRSAGGVGAPLAPSGAAPAEEFGPRFQFIKGALGAIGVVAIAVVVLALTGGTSKSTGSHWSAWKPVDNGVDPAVQIANHVAPEYRQDGKQIVDVTGGPPAYQSQPLVLALLQSGKSPSELNGNAVLYQLCGRGSSCAISGGAPSAERGLLLRREALELALYTFHYLPGVSQVVVTIPPAPKASKDPTGKSTSASSGPNRALFFRPQTVADELNKPLAEVLPAPTPDVVGMNTSRNAGLVANVTGKALYDFSIEQADSTYVLVLEPPGLGG